MNVFLWGMVILTAFSCKGMESTALPNEKEFTAQLGDAQQKLELTGGDTLQDTVWHSLIRTAQEHGFSNLLTNWVLKNAHLLKDERIREFFDLFCAEPAEDRKVGDGFSEEAGSDLTQSWDPDEKTIRGGGSGSGESGSGTYNSEDGKEGKESNPNAIQKLKSLFGPKKKQPQQDSSELSDQESQGGTVSKKSPRPSPRPSDLPKRKIIKRPKLKKSARKEYVAKIEKQLALLVRRQTHIDDREWGILLATVQKVGLFDLLVTWVKQNSALLSLSQIRALYAALVKEEDLYSAGIELAKENVFKLDKDESSADEELLDEDAQGASQEDEKDLEKQKNGVKRKTLHWGFEKKWNIVKAYFLLLLDVLFVYSRRVHEETTSLFPYDVDEDLAEILRLAILSYAPGVETTLCQTLRNAVNAGGGEAQEELVACLSHIVFEALDDNRPEDVRLEPAARDCLVAIIDACGGDISNEALLGAFVFGCGAKLEPDLFEDLLVRVRELDVDENHAPYRLNREKSCFTMLQDWSIAHFENLKKVEKHMQRLTTFSYKQILAEQDSAEARSLMVENKLKSVIVKNADVKATREANRYKITPQFIEGMTAMGCDVPLWIQQDAIAHHKREQKKLEKKVWIQSVSKDRFNERIAVLAKKVKGVEAKGLRKAVLDGIEEVDGLSEFSKRKREISKGAQAVNLVDTQSGLPLWLVRRTMVIPSDSVPLLTQQDESDDVSAGELPPLPGAADEDEGNSREHPNSSQLVPTPPEAGSNSVSFIGEPVMKKTPRDKPPRKALPQPPASSGESKVRSHIRNSSHDNGTSFEALESSGLTSQTASQIEAHGRTPDRKDNRRRGVTLMKDPLSAAITRPTRNDSLSSMIVPDQRGSGQVENLQEETSGDSTECLPEDTLE